MLRLPLALLGLLALPTTAAQAPLLVAEPAMEVAVPFVNGAGGVVYSYDDGAASVNIGPPSTFDPDMLWGNYYLTEPAGDAIVEVSVAFGGTFPSRDGGVTFWLLDDPDMDLDPRNATALASVTMVPTGSGNDFFVVPFPETVVSGAFFVGASAQLLGGQDRPARLDTDARADRSWFFYDGDISAIIDDLASAAFGTRMDDATQVPFPGAFMVRAVGVPQPLAGEGAPAPAVLGEAAPNPSTGRAAVPFTLARASHVRLDVVDALGRSVARLADGPRAAGPHRLDLDMAGLAPGLYTVRLIADGAVTTRRITVAR